jgi:hypothetical protein
VYTLALLHSLHETCGQACGIHDIVNLYKRLVAGTLVVISLILKRNSGLMDSWHQSASARAGRDILNILLRARLNEHTLSSFAGQVLVFRMIL